MTVSSPSSNPETDQLKRLNDEDDAVLTEQEKAIPRGETWAKLNSLSKRFKNIEVAKRVLTIGRIPDNDVQILDQRLSGRHCNILRKFDEEGKMVVVV